MRYTAGIAGAAVALTVAAAAQELPPGQPAPEIRLAGVQIYERSPVAPVEARITRGAPYSAEAVTETVQVLSDGNRIVRRTTARVYRDGEGRTRREQLALNGTDLLSISISDPVAESTYVLNPQTKTAHRNGVIVASPTGSVSTASVTPFGPGVVTATRTPDGGVTVSANSESAERRRQGADDAQSRSSATAGGFGRGGGGGGRGGAAADVPVGMARGPALGNTTREDLGQQVIEGVVATGSRSTTVILAGAIGNEQPIRITSEQWFSPDLQVLVLTKHSDPRTGENTYRLVNVVQAEPAKTLFEVPADYTLRDSVIRRQFPLMP